MVQIILINGCGGAGKDTSGKKLLEVIPQGALIDIKSISRTQPWDFNDYQIGLKNASSLINNFIEAKFVPIIFTGGIFDQNRLDYFLEFISPQIKVHFFWLHVEKSLRDIRRVKRARDNGDQPEYLDQIDSVFTDPGELQVRNGKFTRIDAANLEPDQVVTSILSLSGVVKL